MRERSNGAWRFGDVVPCTHDASGFDSDDDKGEADRAIGGSTAPIAKRDQYDADWGDIDSARRPAMEAARLMHTARQMVGGQLEKLAGGSSARCGAFIARFFASNPPPTTPSQPQTPTSHMPWVLVRVFFCLSDITPVEQHTHARCALFSRGKQEKKKHVAHGSRGKRKSRGSPFRTPLSGYH